MKRLHHISVGPRFEASELFLFPGFGGEQNDRNVAGTFVALQGAADFIAVLLRHHHIADHQIGNGFDGLRDADLAVCGFQNCVFCLLLLADVGPHVGIVFDDEEDRVIGVWLLAAGHWLLDAGYGMLLKHFVFHVLIADC